MTSGMRQIISLSVLLLTVWLLNSGHYNPLLLSLGAASILFVLFVSIRMDIVDDESQPIHILSLAMFAYWLWLLKELIVSNIDVTKRIWLGKSSIDPQIKTLSLKQKSALAQVIYANSITLTPGTITMELNEDSLIVHSLCKEGMLSLETETMSNKVCNLES
jgi:multicomponent Na+:H+ antiporter subunit E